MTTLFAHETRNSREQVANILAHHYLIFIFRVQHSRHTQPYGVFLSNIRMEFIIRSHSFQSLNYSAERVCHITHATYCIGVVWRYVGSFGYPMISAFMHAIPLAHVWECDFFENYFLWPNDFRMTGENAKDNNQKWRDKKLWAQKHILKRPKRIIYQIICTPLKSQGYQVARSAARSTHDAHTNGSINRYTLRPIQSYKLRAFNLDYTFFVLYRRNPVHKSMHASTNRVTTIRLDVFFLQIDYMIINSVQILFKTNHIGVFHFSA